jgi:integrase/recombinase XerD
MSNLTIPSNIPQQANSDFHLLDLWLHGRSKHTQKAYRRDALKFLDYTSHQSLKQTTLSDLQSFADSLVELAPASQARILSGVKSLLSFAHRLGYIPYNVGAPLQLPKVKDTLAERIVTESTVHRILALETSRRNHALLRLLYSAGLRVSELCALKWKDCIEREEGGQLTVFGKGGKTRYVLISNETWLEVESLRGTAGQDDPVFVSRKGSHLDPSQVFRIIKEAAKRAKANEAMSPHWLRHAHASHSLERGAPVHLVQATLGHSNLSTTGRYLHARPQDSSSRYLSI